METATKLKPKFDFNKGVLSNALEIFGVRGVREIDSELKNLSFHNLLPKDHALPFNAKRLLGLNLNFCPTPSRKPFDHYTQGIPRFIRSIRLFNQFGPGNTLSKTKRRLRVPNPSYQPKPVNTIIESHLTQLQEKADELFRTYRFRYQRNLARPYRTRLAEFSNQNDTIIVPTDKNLGPALLTTQQYRDMVCKHLNQSDIYQSVSLPNQEGIRRLVISYHAKVLRHSGRDKKSLAIIIDELDSRGIGRFYGLIKIHKNPIAIRPIVSGSNGILTGLSRWLDNELQPYVKNLQSYVKNSDQVIDDIKNIKPQENHLCFTADASSLYTSIPIEEALKYISIMITDHPLAKWIIDGLRLVMKLNFFEFDGKFYKQLRGTAMGTPVAPSFASLYLGYYEEHVLLPTFKQNLVYYKRYIDDMIVFWNPLDSPSWYINRFHSMLKRMKGITWNAEEPANSINFLDLNITKGLNKYIIRTHQKVLNLYLYTAGPSAHPPGILKGIIFSLFKKFYRQNTLIKDFHYFCNLLLQRLHDRGYKRSTLLRITQEFKDHFDTIIADKPEECNTTAALIIPYDPNGPSNREIRQYLELDQLEQSLKTIGMERVLVAYSRPRNIREILGGTKRLNLSHCSISNDTPMRL